MLLEREREQIVFYSKLLQNRGLTKGTGGNISIIDRSKGLIAITPSAVEYERMLPQDVVVITLDGSIREGKYEPSSEKDMHLQCYKNRSDVGAVVHTHSIYATILSCTGRTLPQVHYLIGFAGGPVSCIPYQLFGTETLAKSAVTELQEKNAVLLGNHGLLAVGADIQYAFNVAEETEFVSEIYYKGSLLGDLKMLTNQQLEDVKKKFSTYGKNKANVDKKIG